MIDSIGEGFRTSRCYRISQEVYDHFVAASGDTNFLHTDDDFARQLGFPEKVMHGVILNAFISHFVGVHFPAGRVVLHAVNTQFKSPCHLGDEIRIDAEVTQVAHAVGAVTLEMVATNLTRGRVAAKSKVQVGLL
ncbi:MAG TPA: MaoC/PaaZ C-terminal domain-containing protein [Candidatus Binatia bacterium]|nr:MaoC/PaaZ C-terminal domain-containing protein [Candidatus Binatia bacterium]